MQASKCVQCARLWQRGCGGALVAARCDVQMGAVSPVSASLRSKTQVRTVPHSVMKFASRVRSVLTVHAICRGAAQTTATTGAAPPPLSARPPALAGAWAATAAAAAGVLVLTVSWFCEANSCGRKYCRLLISSRQCSCQMRAARGASRPPNACAAGRGGDRLVMRRKVGIARAARFNRAGCSSKVTACCD